MTIWNKWPERISQPERNPRPASACSVCRCDVGFCVTGALRRVEHVCTKSPHYHTLIVFIKWLRINTLLIYDWFVENLILTYCKFQNCFKHKVYSTLMCNTRIAIMILSKEAAVFESSSQMICRLIVIVMWVKRLLASIEWCGESRHNK